jgi:hypothetical protein
MSQTGLRSGRLCRRQLAPERLGLHVVRADSLAVDLDDRNQRTVARLQLRISVDPDLLDLEPQLGSELLEPRAGPLAEVAAVGSVEDDARTTATDTSPA